MTVGYQRGQSLRRLRVRDSGGIKIAAVHAPLASEHTSEHAGDKITALFGYSSNRIGGCGDDAVTSNRDILLINIWQENTMSWSNKNSSFSETAFADTRDTAGESVSLYESAVGAGAVDQILSRARESRGANSPARTRRPEAMEATSEAGFQGATEPSSLLNLVVESFALYGGAMHPAPSYPFEENASEPEPAELFLRLGDSGFAPKPASMNGGVTVLNAESTALHAALFGSSAIEGTHSVLEAASVPSPSSVTSDRPSWMTRLRTVIANFWTNMLLELEISRTASALAELDDRTLRDIGIQHRSQIEQVVRHGRDIS